MALTFEEYQKLRENILKVWGDLKEAASTFLSSVMQADQNLREKKNIRQTWKIPRNTLKTSQVMNKKPRINRIRNAI